MEKKIWRAEEAPRSRGFRARTLALALALVLIIGCTAGGTLAWLIDDTDPVVNTFTYGDIDLGLNETAVDKNGDPVDKDGDGSPDKTTTGNEYRMIPGDEYLKDPEVTVLAGNEACWLFVKLVEEGGVTVANGDGTTTTYAFDDYLTYTVEDGWTQLLDGSGNAVEGVYFRFVGEDTDDTAAVYKVLKGDKISVPGSVTKEMLNALDNNGADAATATYPTLSVTAYAVQHSGFEEAGSAPEQLNTAAYGAWQAVQAQGNP